MVEVSVSTNPLDVNLLDVNLTVSYVSGGPATIHQVIARQMFLLATCLEHLPGYYLMYVGSYAYQHLTSFGNGQ